MTQARRAIIGLLTLLSTLLIAPGLHAQPDADTTPELSATPEGIAASGIARLALVDLRSVEFPAEADFALAADLLEIAHRHAPEDLEILRLLIEASGNAGRQSRVNDLTRTLVRLDPEDNVAWLRIATEAVNRSQSVDDRLRRLASLVEQPQLHYAVRSRLALDGALLYREHGETELFAEWLALAIELDETNKDAAALAAQFYAVDTDPIGTLELLLNVLLADPFDVQLHREIVDRLMDAGAFQGASRFLVTTLRLNGYDNVETDPHLSSLSYLVQWRLQGAEQVITELREYVEGARGKSIREIERATAADEPIDEILPPNEIFLPYDVEVLRLVAASATGDGVQLEYAQSEYASMQALEEEFLQGLEGEMDEDERLLLILERRTEAAWLRLWTDFDLEGATKWVEFLRGEGAMRAEALAVLEAWLLMRTGQVDDARTLLEQLDPADTRVRLGFAVLAELTDDMESAIGRYADLSRDEAGTVTGAWAGTTYNRLTGLPAPLPDEAAQMDAIVAPDAVHGWLEALVNNPINVVSIQAVLADRDLVGLQEPVVTITLQNVSPIPLGLGPDRAISSRIMLIPQVEVGVRRADGLNEAIVINAAQRLRLEPYGAVTLNVRPARGSIGWAFQENSHHGIRVRYRVLQGFEVSDEGNYVTGPIAMNTETLSLFKAALPQARALGEGLTRWVATGSLIDCCEGLVAMRSIVAQIDPDGAPRTTQEVRAAFAEAMSARFQREGPLGRSLIATLAPVAGPDTEWLEPLRAALRDATDPDVIKIVLTSRLILPDDPWIEEMTRHEDPAIAAFAATVYDRASATMDAGEIASEGG